MAKEIKKILEAGNKLPMNIQFFAEPEQTMVADGTVIKGETNTFDTGQGSGGIADNSGLTNADLTYQTYFLKRFLSTLRIGSTDLIWMKMAWADYNAPEGYQSLNFQRIQPFMTAPTPLTELETPTGEVATVAVVEHSYFEIGNVIYWSKKTLYKFIHDYKEKFTTELAINALETMDEITRNTVLEQATLVTYANGKTDINDLESGDILKTAEIRPITLRMRTENVNGHEQCNGKYLVITTNASMNDVQLDEYVLEGNHLNVEMGTLGNSQIIKIFDFMIYETKKSAVIPAGKSLWGYDNDSGFDVHIAVICGAEAYTNTGMQGKSKPKMINTPFGQLGLDPLKKIMAQAWCVEQFGAGVTTQEAVELLFHVPFESNLFQARTDYTIANAPDTP